MKTSSSMKTILLLFEEGINKNNKKSLHLFFRAVKMEVQPHCKNGSTFTPVQTCIM